MSNISREEQRLVDYFIEETNDRFKTIEGKIDNLQKFQWTIVGMSGLAGILLSVVLVHVFK